MPTNIERDPFARATLIREPVPERERRSCDWCGSRPGRFRYRWEQDGARPRLFPVKGSGFCSRSCWDAYGE